jgi:hypothetical protein
MVSLKPGADLTHLTAWFDRQSQRASIARP